MRKITRSWKSDESRAQGEDLGLWYNPLTWFEDPKIQQARVSAKASAIHNQRKEAVSKSFDRMMSRASRQGDKDLFATNKMARTAGDVCGSSLTHAEYRALVLREARRAGGPTDARSMYRAQKRVDAALGRAGRTIEIPGARPGRRTI